MRYLIFFVIQLSMSLSVWAGAVSDSDPANITLEEQAELIYQCRIEGKAYACLDYEVKKITRQNERILILQAVSVIQEQLKAETSEDMRRALSVRLQAYGKLLTAR